VNREGRGSQLELILCMPELSVPWEGRSPRELTRGHDILIFRRKAGKSVSEFVDPDQLELWPELTEKAPSILEGAPSLLPLPRRT